jgi:Outer membrane lipoprotein virB7
MTDDRTLVQYFAEGVTAIFWLWLVYRRIGARKPMPRVLATPAKVFRFCLILLTLGLLAGCAGSDPLAVASGPVFPLNAGHWHPTPQDLATPPSVTDQ